jgi:signal transduction histidine kinase
MDKGEIYLSAVTSNGSGTPNDQVLVSVKDSGVGIAPEDLPHLFDMFFQANNKHERPDVGLGIGLTLAHRLIEMHGGTIEAKSEGLGKGSEFIVRLPLTTRD